MSVTLVALPRARHEGGLRYRSDELTGPSVQEAEQQQLPHDPVSL